MKKYLVLFIMLMFINMSFSMQYYFTTNDKLVKKPSVQIISEDENSIVFESSLFIYKLDTKKVGENSYTVVSSPDTYLEQTKSQPELPYIAANFAIEEDRIANIEILNIDKDTVKVENHVIPSKGQILRNVNPNDVEYTFSDLYNQGGVFPENFASVTAPYVLRDIKGVTVKVNLFQYDFSNKTLQVNKKVRVKINLKQDENMRRMVVRNDINSQFDRIYSSFFKNYNSQKSFVSDLNTRLLVISYDEFAEAMTPYVEWKMKNGFRVEHVKLSEIGKTANDIKAFIQSMYDQGNLTYIMLVGDAEHVPTLKGVKEGADSDPSFTKLAGNDHVPDAMISRISAKNITDVEYQVAKFISYERYPDQGTDAAWYTKAIGIASNEGNPADWTYTDTIKDGLTKYGFSHVDRIYDGSYSNNGTPANQANVAKAVNDGRSIINYIGHGSKTSWASSRFSNYDIVKLTNKNRLPFIWSVACVNGDFARGSDCFAETWMKAGTINDMKGAVGIFASSTNAEWVPPLHMQAEINLVTMVAEEEISFGALALQGVMKVFEVYGTSPKGSGTMLFEQYHIFGDATLLVRTKTPEKMEVKAQYKNGYAIFNVKANELKNIKVAVYDKAMNVVESAVVDAKGNAKVAIDKTGDLFYTVVGFNKVPVVDEKL